MMPKAMSPLSPNKLRNACDINTLTFQSTDELAPLEGLIGQERAIEALNLGAAIGGDGFNVFVLGEAGYGQRSAVREILQNKAQDYQKPSDWIYVNNFDDEHRPQAIQLPAGTASQFHRSMETFINGLKTAIPAMFESEDYRNRLQFIQEEFEESNQKAFTEFSEKAESQNVRLMRTPMGFGLAPTQNKEILKPETFNALSEDQRKAVHKKIEALEDELETLLRSIPLSQKELQDKIRQLNEDVTKSVVDLSIQEITNEFQEINEIQEFLKKVREDLIDNVDLFLSQEGGPFRQNSQLPQDHRLRRYVVNVMITQSDSELDGAPVVFEDYPTLSNLVGRIEHQSLFGALITDFTLINPGALHRANGGYLIIDARRLLSEPFAWEALKRSLRSNHIKITSASEQLSLVSTISLEPDPIPLNLKIILMGERRIYYLLMELDPDFKELFKIEADFEDEVSRTPEKIELFARVVANLIKTNHLKPLDLSTIGRLVEEASRLADDADRLSLNWEVITDILREANFYAEQNGSSDISVPHLEKAIAKRQFRSERIREKSLENIEREILLIDTEGEYVGQINGLSVLSIGNLRFGRPTRITARVRMGTGKVVDIEREVELGGPLHSKGVLILTSFLSSRYALDYPMSLWSSLVFEQSYSGVEGDSASSAELYALLSALAECPIKQSLAVTGSVNQNGEIQAIGGVNQKIEGFFDICQRRGLNGKQGVLIPQSNVKHLMLRKDIVEAAERGMFQIYPVSTIDQGIEILTGVSAGVRFEHGEFPVNSINERVESRLRNFAEQRMKFGDRRTIQV